MTGADPGATWGMLRAFPRVVSFCLLVCFYLGKVLRNDFTLKVPPPLCSDMPSIVCSISELWFCAHVDLMALDGPSSPRLFPRARGPLPPCKRYLLFLCPSLSDNFLERAPGRCLEMPPPTPQHVTENTGGGWASLFLRNQRALLTYHLLILSSGIF